MGFAISWLAARDKSETSVLASLGPEKTGETEEVPDGNWCSTLVGEWMVIWSNSCEPARFRAPSELKGEVVVCDVEEHVMFASAAAFNDGTLSWRIVDDAQQAQDHLAVEGKPPESLVRIQAEQFARVGDDRRVDFVFEIPIQLAQEVVGFRYDEALVRTFDILQDVVSEMKSKKSNWKFW